MLCQMAETHTNVDENNIDGVVSEKRICPLMERKL